MNKTLSAFFYALSALVFAIPCFAGDFVDNGNGTVTDSVTSLVWEKDDDGTTRTWQQSLDYCNNLSLASFTDWRLPNIKELSSIRDLSKTNPAVANAFPSTKPIEYWSSTTYDAEPINGAVVKFLEGHITARAKTELYYARCVRSN